MKILVAGESAPGASTLARGLADAGHQVIEARDGEQALTLARAARPDSALSDAEMPRMSGYDFCRAIRRDESLSAIPVILLAERPGSLDVIRGLDAGADAFVATPYDAATLVERIEAVSTIAGAQNRQVAADRQAIEYLTATFERRCFDETERLQKRVRELKLLQAASRLLSERSFNRATLHEVVKLIPAACVYPEHCEARVDFRDVTVTTPGWQPTPRRQSVSFSTTGGTGIVEVAYVDGPIHGDTFLPEEHEVLSSLSEMLVSYAERELAEERRKSLENQLRHSQKMEALGTLAGGIAHDFNNLLTAIGTNAQLALEEETVEPVRESLIEIYNAFTRAAALVRRILLFSRRQESERKPVAMASVVEEVVTLLRAGIPRSVDVRVQFAPDLPMISADASQIHQVMMNLVTNAAHAMGDRGGTLTIEADHVAVDEAHSPSAVLAAGPYVRLTVADTGTGISAEIVDRIFDPFFTTKGHEGTGLGLAVVDTIVHDHQGAITVESELERGTTFRLFFPVAATSAAAVAASAKAPVRGTGQHIMYVDDEESVAFVMTRLIESLGYRCTAFADPHAALQAFRTAPQAFDAVITDMSMPSMSGLDLARLLIGVRSDVPVAIISGNGVDENTLDTEGVQARIHKPPTVAELSSALNDLLRTVRD